MSETREAINEKRWAVFEPAKMNSVTPEWVVLPKGYGPISGRPCREVTIQADALEPLPEPSAPRIDDERWAYFTMGGYWAVSPPDSKPQLAPLIRVRVLDVASWEELKEAVSQEKRHRVYYQNIVYQVCNVLDRANGTHIGNPGALVCGTVDQPTTQVQTSIRQLAEQVSALTRERDEARDRLANAGVDLIASNAQVNKLKGDITLREAHDRVVVLLVADKDRRIAELERELSEARASITWQANVSELEQENQRLAEATRKDLERIDRLERELAEATKPCLVIEWGNSKGTLADLHDGQVIKGTGPDGVPFVLTVKRGADAPPPTASGPDEWWESVATNVAFYLTLAIPSLTYTAEGIQEHLARLLRRFAPAQRYPEVCEVEKAMKDARWCFSWALERENEDGDPNFEWAVRNHWSSCGRAIIATGSTPALACRAALDAKERADGA